MLAIRVEHSDYGDGARNSGCDPTGVQQAAAFDVDSASGSGAPRPMKMGTTLSPRHYDAVAAHAIRSDNRRRTAMLPDGAESTLTKYANSGIVRS